MPFALRIRYFPALGTVQELHTRLTERVTAVNAQGERAGLTAQMYGDGPPLQLTRVFPDLAAAEKAYKTMRALPAAQNPLAQLAPLLRVPVQTALWEVLAPPPPGPAAAFMTVSTSAPAPGRWAEVLAMLQERRSAVNARGGRVGLWQQVSPLEGPPAFTLATLYPSLADFEDDRRQNLEDAASRAFFGTLAAALRQPLATVLLEVIVAVPS